MFLSPAQLQAIAADIKAMHLGWAVQTFGMAATGITPEVYSQLVAGGYVLPQQVTDWALSAYQYGQAQGWQQYLGNYDPPNVPVAKIQALYDKAIEDGLPPMNKAQQASVVFIRQRGAQYVVGLGNRVADDFTTLAIESETEARAELREVIATETAESLIRRETAKKLASRLGNATGDWARDLDRIARTEIVNAQNEGQVDAWQEPIKTMGFRVAKRPAPDACKSCKKAYLMPDGTPRIFDEAELRANGTNFGRKQKDWLPVIGTLHPNCACMLIIVPPNFGFNAEGQMVPLSSIKKEAE
jgi:hypothetical protein